MKGEHHEYKFHELGLDHVRQRLMADNDTPPPAETKEEVVLGEDGQVGAEFIFSVVDLARTLLVWCLVAGSI